MNRTDIHSNICDSLKELYRTKNQDYGDSFSKLRTKYGNVAILIRLNDKLSRAEQLMLNGNQQVKDESIDDTLRDLANYALMELVEREYDRQPIQCGTIEAMKEVIKECSSQMIHDDSEINKQTEFASCDNCENSNKRTFEKQLYCKACINHSNFRRKQNNEDK